MKWLLIFTALLLLGGTLAAESVDVVAYPEDKVAYLFDGGEGIGIAELVNPTTTVDDELYLSNCGLFTCSLYVAFTPVADLDTAKYPIQGKANDKLATSTGVKVFDKWTTTTKEPIYSTTEKYYELTEVDNKTGVNSTVKVYYNETTVTGYKDVEKEVTGYVPLEGTLGAGKTYLLRFDYSRTSQTPIDLIPQFGESASGKLESWAWWNTTFNYKTCLTINITANQTELPLVDLNETNTNGSDIRVVWENSTTELAFWREIENPINTTKNWDSSTASGVIWANTTAIQGADRTNAQICLYYNASGVSDNSNCDKVFQFCDLFSGTAPDASKWNNGTGVSVSGGFMNLSGTISANIQTTYNFTYPVVLDYYINSSARAGTNGFFLFGFFNGTNKGIDRYCDPAEHNDFIFVNGFTLDHMDLCGGINAKKTLRISIEARDSSTTIINVTNSTYGVYYNTSKAYRVSNQGISGGLRYDGGSSIAGNTGIYRMLVYEYADAPTYTSWGTEQTNTITSSITLISQTPTNLTNSNIFASTLQISYNGSADLTNSSLMLLHYKTNNSISDCLFITNGTATCGWYNKTGTNVSTVWNFTLGDNAVYPATYNINETYMEATGHSSGTITNRNQYFRIELLNISSTSQYNMFEVYMQNQTAGTTGAEVYYCNSTYSTGSPATDSNCALIYTQAGFNSFNHSHSVNSKHLVIPMGINTTTGKVKGVTVSANSSFLIRGPQMGTWEYYYISDVSRATASRTSSNAGVTWSNFAGTIDSHLHQFYGNETFYYYASYNETTNSTLNSNTLNLTHIPPTSPQITVPTNNTYFNNTLNITYLSSFAPDTPATNISYYSLYLVDINEVAVKTLTTNNSLNLFYAWDTTTTTEGQYRVKVIATDTGGYTSYAMSVPFIINPRANSNATLGYPSNGQNFTIAPGTAITMNATLSPNIWNYCTINYTNGTITTVNSTFPYCNATISSPSNTTYTWNATFYDDFGTNKTSATYTFNVSYPTFTINNYTYTTPQYETVAYSRTINFSLPSNESLNSAVVEYNSVNFSTTCTNVSTTYYCELTNTPAPPIATNGTVKTSTWYINYTYLGSTAVQTQSYNTTILYGVWPTAILSDEEIAMSSNIGVNLSYSNASGFLALTATLSANASVGGNSGSLSCSGGLCSGNVVAPTVTKNTIYQVVANYIITSPFWGTSVTRNVSIESNAGRETSTLQTYTGTCTSASNYNDSSWSTYTTAGTSCVLYENYTMTQMANTTAWRTKDTAGTRDITIPEDCWGSTLQFKVLRNGTLAQYYCWNYTTDSFVMLNSYTFSVNYYLYEENLTTANWYNLSYVRVVPYGLTSCTSGSPLFYYNVVSEDTLSAVTANYMQAFTLITDAGVETNHSFSGSASSWSICFVPPSLTGNVSSFEQYTALNYDSRDNFLSDVEISGAPYNITIYMPNATTSELTIVTVKENGLAVEGATVYVQRFYPGNSTYTSIATLITDDTGRDSVYLTPNTIYYRFVVLVDGAIVHTSTSQKIICDPAASTCAVNLNIEPTSLDYWTYYGDISGACTTNLTTNIISCVYADTHGTLTYARLIVTKLGVTQVTSVCDTNSTAVSGTLYCDLGVNATGIYTYYLMAKYNPEYSLDSGSVDLGVTDVFGGNGLLLGLLMFLTLAFIGLWSPPVGIILGLFALAGAFAIGMVDVSWAAIAAIFVSGIILAIKMRS